MTYSKKECIFKMTGAFLASFILMGVFLLPYFAYVFGRDIPFSRTTLDVGNNRRNNKDTIFDVLMRRMVNYSPIRLNTKD